MLYQLSYSRPNFPYFLPSSYATRPATSIAHSALALQPVIPYFSCAAFLRTRCVFRVLL